VFIRRFFLKERKYIKNVEALDFSGVTEHKNCFFGRDLEIFCNKSQKKIEKCFILFYTYGILWKCYRDMFSIYVF